nr:unnamed protein product [Digitaria exilis]
MHDLSHARPHIWPRVQAHHAQINHEGYLRRVVASGKPWINHVEDRTTTVALDHPVSQHDGIAMAVALDRPPATDDLQEEGAEREHVRRGSRLAVAHELRRESGEPEVTQASIHLTVQEHVACLDVSVHDDLLPVLVQIQEA